MKNVVSAQTLPNLGLKTNESQINYTKCCKVEGSIKMISCERGCMVTLLKLWPSEVTKHLCLEMIQI